VNIVIHRLQKLFTSKNVNKINVFALFLMFVTNSSRAQFTTTTLTVDKSIPDGWEKIALMSERRTQSKKTNAGIL
jgi:hypothetical protein